MEKETLYKFFDGKASREEKEAVRIWLESSPENEQELFKEREFFDAMILSGSTKVAGMEKKSRPFYRTVLLEAIKIAAVFAITVASGTYFYKSEICKIGEAMNTITVPAGQRANLTLADGTNVWLNARSEMRYPAVFTGNKREITLDGEAYFEVAKDSLNRFVVQAGDLAVEALGTSFNVKAYEEDNQAVVTLFQGKVKTSVGRDEAFLLPDQAVTYLKNKGQLKKSTLNDAYRACLWRNNELAFNDEALSEIAVLLNRMYNIQVVFKSEKVKALRFTGVITNNSLDNIIELISLTSPIIYTSKGDTIIIDEKK